MSALDCIQLVSCKWFQFNGVKLELQYIVLTIFTVFIEKPLLCCY